MKILVRIVGLGWAFVGASYLHSLYSDPTISNTSGGIGLLIAMFVFILPGLFLAK